MSDQPALSEVEPNQVSTNPEILDFLRDTKLKAIVLKTGVFYHAIDNARMVMRLSTKLRDLGLAPTGTKISPMEISNWKDRSTPSSGSKSVSEGKVSNQSVRHILSAAIEAKSSDIYLSINNKTNVARLSFRTFGFKRLREEFSAPAGNGIATSIWSMSDNNSWNKNAPCDVAITFTYKKKDYRVRANSVKTVSGNSLVLRVRDPECVFSLSESGYSELQSKHIQHMMAAPGGLMLVTGETNSGKSTTLDSLVAGLSDEQHIISLCDPVEAIFPHVEHIEINHHAEDAEKIINANLAATVRQNPDTLILGEIRDSVTAKASMNMSIQGKKVMSTLHTKQCTSAIPRLINLGVDKSLTSLPEFITGIVSQNLVPLLCQNCCLETHPDGNIDLQYRELFGSGVRFRSMDGCTSCAKKVPGVAGETLVAEVYPLCLDRTAGAFRLIAEDKLFMLPKYMKETFGVQTKFEHAAEKIWQGLIDPIATAGVIGEFFQHSVGAEAAEVVAA